MLRHHNRTGPPHGELLHICSTEGTQGQPTSADALVSPPHLPVPLTVYRSLSDSCMLSLAANPEYTRAHRRQ
jgi:hypothetical protein